MKDAYAIVSGLVGVVTFVGTWIYCVAEYGFLLGVGLGWLPAMITAVFAALLWPLLAIALLFFLAFLFR